MPQMSPMNWIFISIVAISFFSLMKIKINYTFSSKNNQMKNIKISKTLMKW